jgi:hypothetical protein
VVCTEIAIAAINVKVLDSVSGLGLSFSNLWARARDGTYMDSTLVPFTIAANAPRTFGLAYEREGTYDVSVRAAGYREWTRSHVVVKRDQCHVIPVSMTAYLQR